MDERAVQGKKTAGTRGSTRSIAFVALTIAPFAIPDVVKAVAAVACARAVTRAVPRR